jgi:SAM-dependent methyltransferase
MSLDSAQEASRAQFERQSDRYGRTHVLADTADLDEAVAGFADFPASGLALDVATGGGHTALWLAKRGFSVTAGDLSERMLENAALLAREDGFEIRTVLHSAEELPVPDRSLTVVSCRVAAHHFSSPEAFVQEVARVLVPGGWFILIDGTVPDESPSAVAWLHALEKLRDPSHGSFLSPREWSELCRQSGLAVERCHVGRLLQPDLNWYFETAGTTPENREAVLELIQKATPDIRDLFDLQESDGRCTWYWHRLQLIARMPTA